VYSGSIDALEVDVDVEDGSKQSSTVESRRERRLEAIGSLFAESAVVASLKSGKPMLTGKQGA
jgi:hypothetical protein